MSIVRGLAAWAIGLAALLSAAPVAFAGSEAANVKAATARDALAAREFAMLVKSVGFSRAMRLRAAKSARIIGGTTAGPDDHPFQVALIIAGSDPADGQFCGGVLFKPNKVVTAAHCSFDFSNIAVWPTNQVQVYTNSHNLRRGGTIRGVRSIKIHPKFDKDSQNRDYDVAVWTLKSRETRVDLAKLPNSLPPVGTQLQVTGWGNTSTTGESFPDRLRKVLVPLVSRTDCNDADSYNGLITSRMICAGLEQGGKTFCTGDSGGPLTRKSGGKYQVVVGIVSLTFGCSDPEIFGIYANMNNNEIKSFIQNNIQ